MSGSGDEGSALKGLGSALVALIGGVLGKFACGWETLLGNLLAVGAAVCALAFSLLYQRYQGVLAASELPSFKDGKFSPERAGYDKLRRSLADETAIARIYAKRLTGFLDWVERFFGDQRQADRSLFPHASWLQKPRPIWTAPAFDRCLLLALIYPILTIFLIWGISGHVGPAEASLRLPEGVAPWRRVIAMLLLAGTIYSMWRFPRTTGWNFFLWFGVAVTLAGATTGATAGTGASVSLVFVAAAVAMAFVEGGADAMAIAIAAGFGGAATHASVRGEAVAGALAFGLAGCIAIPVLKRYAKEGGCQGILLALFVLAMATICLATPYWLSPRSGWYAVGPLMLFLGLLTIVNAPFDWLSLGLTRALLRRGLELKGWWPLLLALIDAALAVLIVAALSIAMILGIQAFDGAAVLGGGTATLSVADVLAGIGNPQTAGEPEYWWVYALLLSTMIPSMINLAIGGMALMRGIPGLRPVLYRQLPANTHVSKDERKWIALLLAFQDVIGVVLGILAQALILWLLFAYVLPWFSLGLLEMANDIAALDLPRRALSALLSAS